MSSRAAPTETQAMTEPGRESNPPPVLGLAASAVPLISYPAGLTAREVEVLRLLAEGLSDAQIAERLVISRRTVHGHLRSIYGKLDVSSRTAAARFAIDHRLV